ncbi:MAG: hypothetical protein ABI425_04675 [Patescibacteria group bacterium]
MTDQQSVWIPPKSIKNRSTSARRVSFPIFVVLFLISLLAISIPILFVLKNSSRDTNSSDALQEIPSLFANCKIFYQSCATSLLGVANPTSLERRLRTIQSPLLSSEPVRYGQQQNPDTFMPPSGMIQLIATQHNLNPFLILTLSELQYQTVSTAAKVHQEIIDGGTLQTFFWDTNNRIADELSRLIQEVTLTPNMFTETATIRTIAIGNKQYNIEKTSLGSQIILKYLASISSSSTQFEQYISDFTTQYTLITGIDPSLNTFESDPRLSK